MKSDEMHLVPPDVDELPPSALTIASVVLVDMASPTDVSTMPPTDPPTTPQPPTATDPPN